MATIGPMTLTEIEKVNANGSTTVTDTLSTARGNLVLAAHAVGTETWTATGSIVTYDYTITGGTKAFAKATGVGSIIDTSGNNYTDSLSFVAQQLPPSTPFNVNNSYIF